MNIGANLPPEETAPVFYIGQHESQREAVPLDLLSQAQDLGYDFLTTQITTSGFHSRVLEQLTEYYETTRHRADSDNVLLPVASPLTPLDTSLTSDDSNTAVIAIVSPWIDPGSRDPIIARISRQVLNLEVAYAAFCGINNIIIHGPSPSSGIIQFARAIYEALGLGPYIQIHIVLPMAGELEQDFGKGVHLSELAGDGKDDNIDGAAGEEDAYGIWDIWNTIRTMCNYSQKLSIGMNFISPNSYLFSSWSDSVPCNICPYL